MKGTILIGSKNVEMAANAASPFVYKQVFHEDLLLEINKMDMTSPDVNVFAQLSFIMAKQGESIPLDKLLALSDTDYITWLCGFEPGTFDRADTINEIVSIWRNQSVPTSEQKN